MINIVGFYDVFCDVEPKRRALQSANDELAAAQDKFSKIKAKIMVCVKMLFFHCIHFIIIIMHVNSSGARC